MTATEEELSLKRPRSFAVVCVLGPPGAGKGTLCAHLAQTQQLSHYSVGDGLRHWMHANHDTALAEEIRDRLQHQGFLQSHDLNPFIERAVEVALRAGMRGILIDGFPRCMEQLVSLDSWPFQDRMPLSTLDDQPTRAQMAKPDIVLAVRTSKEIARVRYVRRNRDSNDQTVKFERRFDEYIAETRAVEDTYAKRGLLIEIDANGSRTENVANMCQTLEENILWQRVVVEGRTDVQIIF